MNSIKKPILYLFLVLFSFSTISCFDDLFGIEDDEEYYYDDDSGSGSGTNAGYDFTFTCPGGTTSTVPIPEESAQCQAAYEYFAEIYGCNNYDYFNDANCRMCYDCGYESYCSVCE